MERSRINSHRWLVGWIALVAWLPSLGCQNVTEERLLGTWELDGADRLAKLMTGGSKSKPAMDGILGSVLETVVNQMEATMEVEFGRGGSLITRTNFGGQQSEKMGTWKTIRSMEQEVVIWVQLGQEDPNEITVTLVDQNTIKMVPPNIAVLGKIFTFQRVQK